MKNIERKVGANGSVNIPKSMRMSLGLEPKEKVNLEPQEDGNILINRIEGTCIFCDSVEDVQLYKGRYVCEGCRKDLGLNDEK